VVAALVYNRTRYISIGIRSFQVAKAIAEGNAKVTVADLDRLIRALIPVS
jgi:hypothetical protein